jgi:hypothetical protein
MCKHNKIYNSIKSDNYVLLINFLEIKIDYLFFLYKKI